MITFLGSIKAGLSEKDAESCVRYACALDQFEECGGPRDATAVGKSLGLPKGTVHDLLNEKRRPWSAIEVRHKLGLAVLGRRIDGIVICHFFTDYSPGYTILTAHAFAEDYRVLIAARRVKCPADRPVDEGELDDAYRSLLTEIGYLLSHLEPPQPVPVLAESPFVGQAAIANLALSELDYLAELAPSWSAGGIMVAGGAGGLAQRVEPGGTLRSLFQGPRPEHDPIASCQVVLQAWSPDLGNWAVALGPKGPSERCFLGRVSSPEQLPSGSGALHEERVRRWAARDLSAGAWQGYGLEAFHAPQDVAFGRHCTMFTLRDAYRLDRCRG